MAHEHSHKVKVYHATAPTCHWSWGYEPVFNRLKLVYGDQIGLETMTLCVWENFDDYLKEYGMKWSEFNPWLNEIQQTIGLPVRMPLKRSEVPFNMMPASLGAMAAYRQGAQKGLRFVRAVLRRSCVEGQDVSKDEAIVAAGRESGLNLARFKRDFADKRARTKEYGSQGHGWPELPLSYFAIVVSDGHRHVVLEHAFDPATVEGAVDFIAGGRLRKRKPTDVAGYLAEHGPAPTKEIERVFALKPEAALRKLNALQKSGKVERQPLAGAAHWSTARRR